MACFGAELEAGERSPGQVLDALLSWQYDGFLAHVRDESELELLPEAERVAWRAFWAEVQRRIDELR